MANRFKLSLMMLIVIALLSVASCNTKESKVVNSGGPDSNSLESKKLDLTIILGSTRKGRTSDKIGNALKAILDKRLDISSEIVDLNDYNLPFLNEEIAPANRKEILDPVIKKWSDKIKEADAFIIVVPEYNSGYPGVLKNALDSLYTEWNNKPVAFVGYSGGPSGASNAVAQLHQVAKALKMIPVSTVINIGESWKAFDSRNKLVVENLESNLSKMVDQIKKNLK